MRVRQPSSQNGHKDVQGKFETNLIISNLLSYEVLEGLNFCAVEDATEGADRSGLGSPTVLVKLLSNVLIRVQVLDKLFLCARNMAATKTTSAT